MKPFSDVLAFHYKFDVRTPNSHRPHLPAREVMEYRLRFLQEELDELKKSVANEDLPGALDALVDLNYVSYGTAIFMGITPACWEEAWNEVQRANMEKRRASRADDSKRGHELDVVKPKDWRGPDLVSVLRRHGWEY